MLALHLLKFGYATEREGVEWKEAAFNILDGRTDLPSLQHVEAHFIFGMLRYLLQISILVVGEYSVPLPHLYSTGPSSQLVSESY